MGTGAVKRWLQTSFKFGDLKLLFPSRPAGRGIILWERGNAYYESNTQDYAKNGKTGIWIVIGDARAPKRAPASSPSQRISGNAGAGQGGECRTADHVIRSGDATAEILGRGPPDYKHPNTRVHNHGYPCTLSSQAQLFL